MKPTRITIDHDTNTASITVKQRRYIKKYMQMAEKNHEWKMERLKTNKNMEIISVTFSFPANRLRITRPLSDEQLRSAQRRAAYARLYSNN